MKRRRSSLRGEMAIAAIVFVVASASIAFVVMHDAGGRAPLTSAVGERPHVETRHDERMSVVPAAPLVRDAAPAPAIAPPPALSPRASVQSPATKSALAEAKAVK